MVAAAARLIPPSLHVDALLCDDDAIAIRAIVEGSNVRCPVCGELADRVHGHATRTLADLPWAGIIIRLQIRVRTFFCDNPACPRRIFSERLEGIAAASARRTTRQRDTLTAIAVAIELAEDFLIMLRRRKGERLPIWLDAAETSEIDDLARFARKLRTDLAAVQAGLTLRQSNGQTEGQVNRLKLRKRQGYGRAKIDLLRKRVLQAA